MGFALSGSHSGHHALAKARRRVRAEEAGMELVRRMFEHVVWANQHVLDGLRKDPGAIPGRSSTSPTCLPPNTSG